MTKAFRDGFVGALMDEYERAAENFKDVVQQMSQDNFTQIADAETEDPDCRSVQTIMNHVVRSGYGYANYIRKQFGEKWTERKEDYNLDSPQKACYALDNMLTYSDETLENKWNLPFDEAVSNTIKTTWGQDYDFEQLFEHAIVHILRHRRQIDKFIIKINSID